MLVEKKLDDIEAGFKHTSRKSLKRLAQEVEMSKSSARTATQLLKLRPYKTTVIHTLQPQGSFLQLVFTFCCRRKIDSQLIFFSDEAWFHLQGYINMQNNRYWSSQIHI
jgi:hypothetical protein